ncbi:MAG: hypothetical protein GEU78_02345 [Actinobacteria bacterium]|nr:hypothetical protein [Actinomycetota bacterium]
MDRKAWDQIVSGAGTVLAVAFLLLGAAAFYGGQFGQDNVKDRLEPQNITFPPAEAMSPEEKAIVGDFAGEKVDTGTEAEAFSRYIGLHLTEVNEGKTYSETSAQARGLEEDDPARAELDAKVQTLFRGETLRGLLLNAYGWWVASTIALYAGAGMVIGGIILAVLAALGFRHAKVAAAAPAKLRTHSIAA